MSRKRAEKQTNNTKHGVEPWMSPDHIADPMTGGYGKIPTDIGSLLFIIVVAVVPFVLCVGGIVFAIAQETIEANKELHSHTTATTASTISTIDEIYPMIYQYQMEKKKKREAEQKKTEGSGDQQPVPKTNKNEKRKDIGSVKAGAAGYYAASVCLADSEADYESHDFNTPDSYVPDDFEPDLDPYDRQALYDEKVIDDFVIAGGGNPFDFDDRMVALSDPFGFGGDGDTWD